MARGDLRFYVLFWVTGSGEGSCVLSEGQSVGTGCSPSSPPCPGLGTPSSGSGNFSWAARGPAKRRCLDVRLQKPWDECVLLAFLSERTTIRIQVDSQASPSSCADESFLRGHEDCAAHLVSKRGSRWDSSERCLSRGYPVVVSVSVFYAAYALLTAASPGQRSS